MKRGGRHPLLWRQGSALVNLAASAATATVSSFTVTITIVVAVGAVVVVVSIVLLLAGIVVEVVEEPQRTACHSPFHAPCQKRPRFAP